MARAALVSGLLGAVFAASTLIWLKLDHAPPEWDDAWYLTNSLTVYDALAHNGIAGYFAKLNSVFGFKAPLIAALPTPFYLVFGRHWHAAYLVNIASMWILFAALYRIATRWWNSRAAVFAIAIAGAMPLLYGLARWYMVEYVMTALLAVAACALIESDSLTRDRHLLLFGAACGLGLLLKITFPVFVLPLFAYIWITSAHRARPLLLAALPCLVIALPWYAGHLRPTVAYALDAAFGPLAAKYDTGPIFSLDTIAAYLSDVGANAVSWYFLVLALVMAAVAAFQRRLSRPTNPAAMTLFAWLLPFVVFVFGGAKDIRYIAPILPAAALAVAFLLDLTLPRTLAGTAAGAMLLAFPVLQMSAVSFGIPYSTAPRGYAHRFTGVAWPHDEMLKLIAANSRLKPGDKELLVVGTDRAGLNADNVELTVVSLQLPYNVETTAHEDDLSTLRQRLSMASYFLYKEGGEPESQAFNPYQADLIKNLAADPRFREIPYGRRLPDGGIARIYKNSAPATTGVDEAFVKSASHGPEEFVIDFGGKLALTGLSTVKTSDGTIVKFRWRCIQPPGRAYWCFTHLLDPTGRIVAQHDHRLPELGAGEGGEQEVRLRLRKPVTGLRLRFGLYDPPSGERLHVAPLEGAGSSRFSLTDQSTALLAPVP